MTEPPVNRWRLIADVLAFQVKLLVDGLRDLVMSPISLVAALVGLLSNPKDPGRYFYDTLRWGKSTERWIDLFGALENDPTKPSSGFDEWASKVEDAVAEQYAQGGITKRAKESVDLALEHVHRRRAEGGKGKADDELD